MYEKLLLLSALALLGQVGSNTTNHGHSDQVNAPLNSATTNQPRLIEQDGQQQQPETPRPRAVLTGHRGRDCELAFDPAGQILATGCSRDSGARLWNVSTGGLVTTLPGYDKGIGRLSFSPDGRTLETWSVKNTTRLLSVRTGELKAVLTEPKGLVWSVAFSPDSHSVATSSLYDLSAHLWEAETGGLKATFDHPKTYWYVDGVDKVAFSRDGKTLVTTSAELVYLWDVATAKIRMKLIDPDVRRYDGLKALKGFSHGDTIYDLAISPDGRTIATASRDGTAKLWDLATGVLRATLKGHDRGVIRLTFSPDGTTLATGSNDRTARLWDVASGKLIATLPHKGTVRSLSFSVDSALIATASDNEKWANIWRVATGEKLAELPEARPPAVFGPIGRTLATASRGNDVLLWDIQK